MMLGRMGSFSSSPRRMWPNPPSSPPPSGLQQRVHVPATTVGSTNNLSSQNINSSTSTNNVILPCIAAAAALDYEHTYSDVDELGLSPDKQHGSYEYQEACLAHFTRHNCADPDMLLEMMGSFSLSPRQMWSNPPSTPPSSGFQQQRVHVPTATAGSAIKPSSSSQNVDSSTSPNNVTLPCIAAAAALDYEQTYSDLDELGSASLRLANQQGSHEYQEACFAHLTRHKSADPDVLLGIMGSFSLSPRRMWPNPPSSPPSGGFQQQRVHVPTTAGSANNLSIQNIDSTTAPDNVTLPCIAAAAALDCQLAF